LTASFQSWPALPFVLVGSVMILVHLGSSTERARQAAVMTMAVWAAFLVVVAAIALPTLRGWIAVDGQAAAQLSKSQSQIPARAEVIASQGIIGRFANRQYAYTFPSYGAPDNSGTTFPIRSPLVVFVLTPAQGASEAPLAESRASVNFIEHQLGARVINARSASLSSNGCRLETPPVSGCRNGGVSDRSNDQR
jgi:hypothetical protein